MINQNRINRGEGFTTNNGAKKSLGPPPLSRQKGKTGKKFDGKHVGER